MKTQLEQRLTQLKSEFDSGQKLLSELETKVMTTREAMLRISGAIQVLEEELAKVKVSEQKSGAPEKAAK
jgi:uncharacterized coiled-coil protein SlyX